MSTPIRVPVSSLATFQEIMLSEGWKGKAPILLGTTVQVGNVVFEYEPRTAPVERPPEWASIAHRIEGRLEVLEKVEASRKTIGDWLPGVGSVRGALAEVFGRLNELEDFKREMEPPPAHPKGDLSSVAHVLKDSPLVNQEELARRFKAAGLKDGRWVRS